jgi:type IV pilus assembly protein PilA
MFKKFGSKLKEQKGFTLIELLAVIVILGIIAAIAIPAITNVINKSELKSQAQEGVQIINAAKLYVANEKNNTTDGFDHALANSTTGSTLTKDELMKYLDRVDADSDFEVGVAKDASGVFNYTLVNHPATDIDEDGDNTEDESKTEAQLIEAAK